ncbi:MAG: ATP synthase F1 subunit gamma [Spirochaetota bacterium]|nr:ATP synthase F1 subunit gamma [Spirochaetota bacterium]
MATVREIKTRISSVQNIKKITETMEKIATAKVKKNTDRLLNSREYYLSLVRVMSNIISFIREEHENLDHPLIKEHLENKNCLILVVSSNRGLCGGYNHGVLNQAKKLYNTLKEENKNVKMYAVGKKGIQFFKFSKISLEKSFVDIDDNVTYERMTKLSDDLSEHYSSETVDEIYLVYTKYYSIAHQKPVVEKILPFEFKADEELSKEEYRAIYIVEPNLKDFLNYILPITLEVKLFNTILETNLSEQIARKIAMKQASDSAGEMIKDLTLIYNRIRQSKITKEIIEIIGAAKALSS